MSDHIHDLIGIGLGPFNLGLACLADPLAELDCVFLEARDSFDWHPGLMFDDATLQVPFLADLVTMADPTSRYSFLNFLKETGRLHQFYIRENFLPHRREYNRYCQWAADQLAARGPSDGVIRFGQAVTRVEHDGTSYVVTSESTGAADAHTVTRGRRLVLGTGTAPYVPECAQPLLGSDSVLHAADYLGRREALVRRKSITIIGSGQSAAEVYLDLLEAQPERGFELTWVTRSPRFYPMEYTKLTLELTSPEYTAYFQGLDADVRGPLLKSQQSLYKGISSATIDAIHEALYLRSLPAGPGADSPATTLLTATELRSIKQVSGGLRLGLHHTEQDLDYALDTDALVLATGYRATVPAFLDPIRDRLLLDGQGRYAADAAYAVDHTGREVFVQNGEEHTHGFVAPDLGMAAFRNSVILATILGREPYRIEKRIAFQEFGVPDRLRLPTASTSPEARP